MVQQTTSERKITMQISNFLIPEIILGQVKKHVSRPRPPHLFSAASLFLLFFMGNDFKSKNQQASLVSPLLLCTHQNDVIFYCSPFVCIKIEQTCV